MRAVRPIRRVRLWNHRGERAEALAAMLRDEGIDALAVTDLEAAVRDAHIVSCATLATLPLIRGAWLAPGTHLDLIGSFTPRMREADARCVARASVWVDHAEAVARSGDLVEAQREGAFEASALRGTLADLARLEPGRAARTGDAEITLFKSVGHAIEDLAAAELVVNAPVRTRAVRLYWEDFVVGQAWEFGAMPVTRDAVLSFAAAFDPQPFHLDDAAAEASLFRRLSASGWHTCAMAMRMMCDHYLLEAASLGSPGIDALRWTKPVYPGDVLSVRFTPLQSRPMASRPGVGLVRSRWEVLNQRREIVMTMEGWGMFGRRHATQAVTELN
jgi:acyl dehydratase